MRTQTEKSSDLHLSQNDGLLPSGCHSGRVQAPHASARASHSRLAFSWAKPVLVLMLMSLALCSPVAAVDTSGLFLYGIGYREQEL